MGLWNWSCLTKKFIIEDIVAVGLVTIHSNISWISLYLILNKINFQYLFLLELKHNLKKSQSKIELLQKDSNVVPILQESNKELLDNQRIMKIQIDDLATLKVRIC